jgi:hypothetical protein
MRPENLSARAGGHHQHRLEKAGPDFGPRAGFEHGEKDVRGL